MAAQNGHDAILLSLLALGATTVDKARVWGDPKP